MRKRARFRKTPATAPNPNLPYKFPAQNCGKKVCAPSESLGISPRNGLLFDRRLQPRVPLLLRDARPLPLGRLPDGRAARVFPEPPEAFRYGRPARGRGFLRQGGVCTARYFPNTRQTARKLRRASSGSCPPYATCAGCSGTKPYRRRASRPTTCSPAPSKSSSRSAEQ